MPATVFAICLRARRNRLDSVLMVVDDRAEAEDIAFELRRRGQDVEVREYVAPDDPPSERLQPDDIC